ncbi:MAG: UDP-N-acetylglucosamine 4,6-dehydratase [Bacteroidales bacterium]|nr:UDP-N-acetylglucosamine 4,6-dehydratase [Bacteroidales bacterium]
MINIENFTKEHVIERKESLFLPDIIANKETLSKEIDGKDILVIGGAGSIGSSFIKAVLKFNPSKLVVVDLNENGLAELTRDLRSSVDINIPPIYLTYTLDFADPIFKKIFDEHGGFDIVANFSAHKHVRSEKDKYSVEALLRNNVLKAKVLLDLLASNPPSHFFCVSTDKAANPVNVMGASKKVMEDLIMAYSKDFKVSTARFANVAFSNGSLPLSFFERMMKHQPLVAPDDVKRYFVSLEESGQICMLACILGKSGEVFFPKLEEKQMKTFSSICDLFIKEMGYNKLECHTDMEAKEIAAHQTLADKDYPVYYFKSDTTGEKGYEEFFIEGETRDMERFSSLGVILPKSNRSKQEVNEFLQKLEGTFMDKNFTKAQVVSCLKEFLPNFEHKEMGKNLDQKM